MATLGLSLPARLMVAERVTPPRVSAKLCAAPRLDPFPNLRLDFGGRVPRGNDFHDQIGNDGPVGRWQASGGYPVRP